MIQSGFLYEWDCLFLIQSGFWMVNYISVYTSVYTTAHPFVIECRVVHMSVFLFSLGLCLLVHVTVYVTVYNAGIVSVD